MPVDNAGICTVNKGREEWKQEHNVRSRDTRKRMLVGLIQNRGRTQWGRTKGGHRHHRNILEKTRLGIPRTGGRFVIVR